MSFSEEWEETYKKNLQMSKWPWSDLVSYVMRFSRPDNPEFRVLELGCGAGANVPFFLSLNVKYFSIEGSKSIIKKIKEKYPELNDNIIYGDFSNDFPFDDEFNLIVDRASVSHNTTKNIEKIIEHVYNNLTPDGKFIGIDWFSTIDSEFNKGSPVLDDPYSKKDYKNGPFANIGIIHFSDKTHILNLFKKFEISILEHKIVKTEIPDTNLALATWNFVAKKKE